MNGFAEIEEPFARLMRESSSTLSENELKEIDRFIEVGEYGLALETVVDIFVEQRKCPPDVVLPLIAELAKSMGIAPGLQLRRLRPFG